MSEYDQGMKFAASVLAALLTKQAMRGGNCLLCGADYYTSVEHKPTCALIMARHYALLGVTKINLSPSKPKPPKPSSDS